MSVISFKGVDKVVVKIKYSSDGKRIEFFRVYLPMDRHLGNAQIDISRDNLARYISEGQKVITATIVGGAWVPGSRVRKTKKGYLRTDHNETESDNLGSLPLIEGRLLIQL